MEVEVEVEGISGVEGDDDDDEVAVDSERMESIGLRWWHAVAEGGYRRRQTRARVGEGQR